ncbi:MAG: penicillin-binding protein 2 [Alphaproteobacteria bacterium]|nr:penicillin-binding protein 2 [Alphaproteobacteria bacterium]MBN2779608.1 penicillin-binding protein 2 [Alphaproteobacteria bacterium]
MLDADILKTFSRRTLLLGGGKFILLSALLGRVFYLQVVESKKYKHLSNRNSFRLHILVPPRGRIFDRNEIVFADNTRRYSLFLKPEEVGDGDSLSHLFSFLSMHIELTEKDRSRIENLIKEQGKILPILMKNNLSWEEMAPLAARQVDTPGIFIETDIIRQYPLKEAASHVIGYVGLDKKETRYKDYRFLYRVPDFRTGKSGIERSYNDILTGESGELVQRVNATGRVSESFKPQKKDPVPGKDLKLTLDARLQEYVGEIFDEKSGSVTVMDCHTGEILCSSSFPQYDLSRFEGKVDSSYYASLLNDKYHPMLNKTIEGLYSPGSTFKMLVALAGLEEGVITPSTSVTCTGHMMFGNHKFHCWSKHGKVSMVEAIHKSCDIYFYKLGLKLGIDKINTMARRLGLGEITGVDLVGEKSGQVSNRHLKLQIMGEKWVQGDTVQSSIGQSLTLTTPLQLAVMIARLVNGGKAVTPRFVNNKSPSFEDLGFNPTHIEIIKEGMFSVVNRSGGTATGSAFNVNGIKMGGKTGTAQVRRITKQERLTGVLSQGQLPWHLRNHALFVAYAPTDNPRFVASVVVEHGQSGSIAARIASKILKKTVELYQ